jgi:dUTP pyrophosphatase
MESIKIKKVRMGAVIPKRATEGSAGLDLCACIESPVTLEPGGHAVFPTGIAVDVGGSDRAAFVYARSGLAIKHGVTLSNCVGVIDSDYRGEICVGLVNLYEAPYVIEPGERIAQLIVQPVLCPEMEEVQTLCETERGAGGFGSTGRS